MDNLTEANGFQPVPHATSITWSCSVGCGGQPMVTSRAIDHLTFPKHEKALRRRDLRRADDPQPARGPSPASYDQSDGGDYITERFEGTSFQVELRDDQGDAASRGYAAAIAQEHSLSDLGWDSDNEDGEGEQEDTELTQALRSLAIAGPENGLEGEWEPFGSRSLFLLHLLANVPRSPMSRKAVQLYLAIQHLQKVPDIPSLYAYRQSVSSLFAKTGTRAPTRHQGCEGNLYYMCSIGEKIKRDFAHPAIRPSLQLYPRRGAGTFEVYDGAFMRDDDARTGAPMVLSRGMRVHGYEPCEVSVAEKATLVLPVRWWREADHLWGEGYRLRKEEDRLLVEEEESVRFRVSDVTRAYNELAAAELAGVTITNPSPAAPTDLPASLPLPSPSHALAGSLPFFSVPILLFCDDSSGNVSKKWNKHLNFFLSNAALPRKLQELAANVHFLGTSNRAEAMEMCVAIVEELNRIFEHGLKVWDLKTRSYIMVRIQLILVIGDAPMMAEMASALLGTANFPCRICRYGGTTAEKATPEGFATVFQPGQPRSTSFLKSTVLEMIDLAELDQVQEFKDLSTSTGVKDALAESVIVQLFQENDVQRLEKKVSRAAQRAALAEEKEELLSSQHFNPFFDLCGGFDIPARTPPGILHVFSLGTLKYAWSLTMHYNRTEKDKLVFKDQLQVLLEQASTSGLDQGTGSQLPAKYLSEHADSLVGKELKRLCQVAPTALAPLVKSGYMSAEIMAVWRAVGDLGVLLYVPGIPEGQLDGYIADLDKAVLSVYASLAPLAPQKLLARVKYHLTSHIAPAIRLYGPAIAFNEERFEHQHSIVRERSKLSNKSAASKDITTAMERLEDFTHLISGGFYITARGDPRTASPNILQLMKVPQMAIFRRMYGLEFNEVLHQPGSVSRTTSFKPFPSLAKTPLNPNIRARITDDMLFCTVASISSQAGDPCFKNDFVHLTSCGGDPDSNTCIVRILHLLSTADASTLGAPFSTNFLIVQPFRRRSEASEHYPACSEYEGQPYSRVIGVKDLEAIVMMQHNCIASRCAPTEASSVGIRQERETTLIRKPAIDHRPNGRFILSRYLFRSREALKHLHPSLPTPPPLEEIAKLASETYSAVGEAKAALKAEEEAAKNGGGAEGEGGGKKKRKMTAAETLRNHPRAPRGFSRGGAARAPKGRAAPQGRKNRQPADMDSSDGDSNSSGSEDDRLADIMQAHGTARTRGRQGQAEAEAEQQVDVEMNDD